jgi:myo-inositol-1(or 4)-monophosphatase
MVFLFVVVVFQLVITFNSVVFRFIGEESVAAGEKCDLTDDPTWIVDPVDGTMNFVHSFPHSCISLAVLYQKDIHIGIIYNPILDQMYTAKFGQGAFLNEKPIRVSEETGIIKKGKLSFTFTCTISL